MEKEIVRGIAKTIIDGIKDAQMQIDYACAAKEEGEMEIAHLHLEEAKKRMTGVKDWYGFANEKMGRHHENDAAYDAMEEHYRDWAHKIKQRIADFKM